MLERRINLEEILLSKFNFTDVMEKAMALQAMKEAVRQALKLASENAILILNEGESYSFVENFPKNLYFEYEGIPNSVAIDEQSILDTIKQVE